MQSPAASFWLHSFFATFLSSRRRGGLTMGFGGSIRQRGEGGMAATNIEAPTG